MGSALVARQPTEWVDSGMPRRLRFTVAKNKRETPLETAAASGFEVLK